MGQAEHLLFLKMIAEKLQTDGQAAAIEALEFAGQPLSRVTLIYSVWGGNLSTPEYQAVQNEMDPKLAAFSVARIGPRTLMTSC